MRGLGERIKRRQEALGLSGAGTARKLGISPTRYSNYVNEVNEPDLEMLVRLCEVLECTPGQLLGIEEMQDSVATLDYNEAKNRVSDRDREILSMLAIWMSERR